MFRRKNKMFSGKSVENQHVGSGWQKNTPKKTIRYCYVFPLKFTRLSMFCITNFKFYTVNVVVVVHLIHIYL